MKRFLLFLHFIAIAFFVTAQNKMLTLEDALVKNKTVLAPSTLKQLQFIYNTGDYVYLGQQDGKDAWKRGSFTVGEQVFLTLPQLNQKLKAAGIDTAMGMPAIKFNESAEWIMTVNGSKIALDPITSKIKVLVPKAFLNKENLEENKAGLFAYLDNFNLYVSDGAKTSQVTTDGNKDIVYASSVHRDEFGITKGTFWSNKGNQLAFYRMDQSMVTDYPVIDWSQRPAKNENIKYPMAGDKSHRVKIGVYNATTGSIAWLKTNFMNDSARNEQYLTNIAWSPDDRFVYVAIVNREQNHMELNQYDAVTGNYIKTLFHETDDKYTEPLVPMLFVKNDHSKFIWQSNRDGWNHLYLYDTSGKVLKQLTVGEWEVLEVKGFDPRGENLFYVSTKESPLSKNLYFVNLKTGISKQVTPGSEMVHVTQISTDGKFILDNHSYINIPRRIQLVDIKTGKAKPLFTAADPLEGYSRGDLTVFPIKGKNDIPLYCRLFKPVNFDSTRKYPVIVYCYGGPHVQLVGNSWNGGAGDYWGQYMAQRGYIVFTLDTRGSDNRGKAFEQAMFRKAGDVQMQDVLTGAEWLKSRSWVDSSNMGLFGWSFGGFLTTDFMLTYPGIFKAAVAGGPVIDWSYYEIMYTERYMDTPKENPEGYAATDLTKKVDRLKGKLLLVHGLQDPVVVQQHSVRFVRAAIDKNIQVDYMIYPGHEHNVLGKDRAHLYQKVTDYFVQYLKLDNKLGF
jgi:dipeptidyl-peptidase-4